METPVEISYAGVVVGRADQVRSLDGEAQGFFLSVIDPMPVGTVLSLSGNVNARVEKVVDSSDAGHAGMYIRVLAAGEDPKTLPYTYYESPAIPEPVRSIASSDSGRSAAVGSGGRRGAETPVRGVPTSRPPEGPIVVTSPPSPQAPLVTSGTIVGEISSARRPQPAPTPAPAAATIVEAVPEPIADPASGSRRATRFYNSAAAPEDELRSPEPVIRGGGGAPPEMPAQAPSQPTTEGSAVASAAFSGAPTVVPEEKSGAINVEETGDLPPAKPLPADARRRSQRRRKTIK